MSKVAVVEPLASRFEVARWKTAVVIGKFYPPHHGHKLLIERALQRSQHVSVIVCERARDTIPGDLRASWLREIHPTAHVMVIDDRYDEHDSAVWAANTIRWLGRAPDVVFTSETYGERYACAMGSAHVLVDLNRTTVPCSGTMIRRDPFAYWHFLESPVRAWFARRVAVVGAESTGTTTLAQALARRYDTVWVPEYGREYSAVKQQRAEVHWTSDEFVHIASEQNAREARAARDANRLLICDTNAWATALWHRRYVGCDDARVSAAAMAARSDLYLLTGDEIPFVQDGLRDGEHIRRNMHLWFEEALSNQSVPWRLLRGSPEARLEEAVTAIDALFTRDRS